MLTNEEDPVVDPTPSTTATKEVEIKKSSTIVTEITDMYEDILQIYMKVHSTTSIPIPKLVLAEACLKISRFLTTVFLNGGWSDTVLTKVVQQSCSNDPARKRESRFLSVADLVKCKGSGLTRFSIAKWVTKIWTMDLDDLVMIDQVSIRINLSQSLYFF
jgi:hypothetical protein